MGDSLAKVQTRRAASLHALAREVHRELEKGIRAASTRQGSRVLDAVPPVRGVRRGRHRLCLTRSRSRAALEGSSRFFGPNLRGGRDGGQWLGPSVFVLQKQ